MPILGRCRSAADRAGLFNPGTARRPARVRGAPDDSECVGMRSWPWKRYQAPPSALAPRRAGSIGEGRSRLLHPAPGSRQASCARRGQRSVAGALASRSTRRRESMTDVEFRRDRATGRETAPALPWTAPQSSVGPAASYQRPAGERESGSPRASRVGPAPCVDGCGVPPDRSLELDNGARSRKQGISS